MAIEDSRIKVVLLDIEGTVCPISFVKDVLFPYSLAALPETLEKGWNSPTFAPYIAAFPAAHRTSPAALLAHVKSLTASDTKAPYLKSLQGHLWKTGYDAGLLICPLFPDVPPALRTWSAPPQNLKIVIYSSGSIPAQKLLFAHTDAGDLTPLITDYFDITTAGPKMEKGSYERILEKHPQWKKDEWLFLSDNVKEVRAAREAGMEAVVVVREGNMPVGKEEGRGLRLVSSFEELTVGGVGSQGQGNTEDKA